jgi:chromosome partitioning protein
MRSILIANPKGGSGKSTFATNLAGYLARAGGQVMLGDIDRQQSSQHWLTLRPATLPHIGTWVMEADYPARPPKGTTHAILDSPAGLHGKKLVAAMKRVDRVIVPLQPSPFDMSATREFLDLLLEEKAIRQGKTFMAVVGNRVDPRTHSARELERFLADYHLPVLAYLRNSQAYIHAASSGLSIFDFPIARVLKDRAQWQPIISWVNADFSRLAGEGF